MSRHPNISEETAAMGRQEAMDTKPQDQFVGRLKFTGCPECGSNFGMYGATRETVGMLRLETIETLSWYKGLNNDRCLYTPCIFCNSQMHIPDGFEPLDTAEVTDWYCRDPMAPDYAALAAEPEVATAGQDSRESAGLEG